MRAPQVNCLEGSTFMVSDLIGDAGPRPGSGSRAVLPRHAPPLPVAARVSTAAPLEALSTRRRPAIRRPPSFSPVPAAACTTIPTLSVIRKRTLGRGRGEDLHEKLTVLNSGREEIVIELSMAFDADFADLFEVKNKQLIKTGTISRRVTRPGSRIDLPPRRLRTPDHHPCRRRTAESRFGGFPR